MDWFEIRNSRQLIKIHRLMNTEKATTKKSKFVIFSVISRLLWIFRKPCIYCGSRDIEIQGNVYDGANNYEYTLKQCNSCKSMFM